MGGVATGAATGVFFEVGWVRRAVGAQKEAGGTAGGRVHQGQAVGFALEYRQAVVMWANTAGKNGVAVVEQVVGGDGGRGEAVRLGHVLGGLTGGDVLENNFQLGEIAAQRDELGVDKHGFAVKQINIGRGDFAVHQQQHARALHGL